jgi:Protein kinase domain
VADLVSGREFAGCRIEEVVGRGGMGVIYRGTDLRLERPVAIKLIAAERASDDGFRQRFEREARLTAAIDHPNVIPVYAAGEEDGHLYLVMRYVAGQDLQALLRKEGSLDPQRAARVVEQVGEALDAAHSAGLVHRDIKPANVLLAGDHVYLSDFGITRADSTTRITESGEWLGTLDFMSPEHLRGERTTARSDVYAVGCLLYCCLTGRPPFQRPSMPATIRAHLDDPPPRASDTPGVPRSFDAVIDRALAKDPADRYASAGDLGRAALAAAAGEPAAPVHGSVARGPAAAEPETRWLAPKTTAAPTELVVEPPKTVAVTRTRKRRPRALIALAVALPVTAALVVALLLATSGGTPTGPLRSSEVAGAARSFARAYGGEDADALAKLLTSDVQRVSSTRVERGRSAVLAEYKGQFAAAQIQGYRLDNLKVTPGWAGRASASYTVTRKGGQGFGGRVVFGVRRVGGKARVALITTQANG